MLDLLKGVRVLDLTSILMGPYATQILGDYGADVIKVEAPGGDATRKIGPVRHEGMGPVFLNANRNKRSLAIDLKAPEGRAVLLRLAADIDVVICNIRPKAMARLGLTYEVFREINPRIIYASVVGFGSDGPYSGKPAYDDLIQGASTMAALMQMAGNDGPRYVPTAAADRIVGLFAVSAILAALHHRAVTGVGLSLEVPMFETMVSFVMGDHMGGQTFDPPLDEGGYKRQLSIHRRPQKTRDGYICALIYSDKQWEAFARLTGNSEKFGQDQRYASISSRASNIDYIYSELNAEFLKKTTAEWYRLLEAADIPVLPMHDLTSIYDDPHLHARDFFRLVEHPSEGPIRTIRFPVECGPHPTEDRPVPLHGEHSLEILREAAFTQAEIEALFASGIVSTPSAPVNGQAAGGNP
jgi:crotonobetainyl-CoA:carnitine CoA-transferase CaiB-like acyl-CoA transferase